MQDKNGEQAPGLAEEAVPFRFSEPEATPDMASKWASGANLPPNMTFEDRFRWALKRVPRGERARTLGKSPRTIDRYLAGDEMPVSVVRRLMEAAHVPLEWLVAGREVHDRGGEYAYLPRYEVRASAGQGLVAVSEEVAETLAFRRDWLSRLGINPQNAGLLTAEGDSMFPTIPDGAIMVVDLSIRDVRNGMIYVMARDGAVIVKRVQIRAADGAILLISDNPRYQPESVTRDQLADLHIAGRVVWAGHTV